MKKTLAAILCLTAVLLTACSGDGSSAAAPESSSSQSSAEAAESYVAKVQDEIGYVYPADAISPDLSKDDPSDDNIRFIYDDKGRVTTYKFTANEKVFMICYEYKDNTVNVTGFVDDVVGDSRTFQLPEFDASAGFTEYGGYFFKGYKF